MPIQHRLHWLICRQSHLQLQTVFMYHFPASAAARHQAPRHLWCAQPPWHARNLGNDCECYCPWCGNRPSVSRQVSGCTNKRKPCSQGWTKAAARFERKNNIAVCGPDAFEDEVGFLGWRDCGFCGDASYRVVVSMKKGLLSGKQSVSTILDA